VADNESFVPFLQSLRTGDIVITVTHDEASQMYADLSHNQSYLLMQVDLITK